MAQPLLIPSSAVRMDGEDYKDAMDRNMRRVHKAVGYYNLGTVQHVARNYSEYQIPEMETWSSYGKVKKAFSYIRDLRFIDWEYQDEEFMRRTSWLYPDDGCFIRAELMVENLVDTDEPLPNKIFVIGNLKVKTPNALGGKISWWYHVAPIVKVRKTLFVLDPALKTKKPLKLAAWLKLMSKDIDNLKIAICDARTLSPGSKCYNPYQYDLDKVMEYQYYYLAAEWKRVVDLGRDPVKELGDNPPWKYLLFGFIPMVR